MPEILHRISIDAPAKTVRYLVTTTDGIARWWTGRAVTGDAVVGSEFAVYFGDADDPAARMRVVADEPDHVEWLVIDGPVDWIYTHVDFTLVAPSADRTTLLFRHAGWGESNEFMAGCSTNWGAYLTSLKHGAETGAFAAFPHGEISRWA